MTPTPMTDALVARSGIASARVSAAFLRRFLRDSKFELQPASLRNWTRRGLIDRTEEGYDLIAVMRLLERHAALGKLTKAARNDTLPVRRCMPGISESEAA